MFLLAEKLQNQQSKRVKFSEKISVFLLTMEAEVLSYVYDINNPKEDKRYDEGRV